MSYAAILLLLMLLGPILMVGLVAAFFFVTNRPRSARNDLLGEDGRPLDEVQLIQDLHHGMTRLERRVESLETILLERSSSKQDHATKDV